MRTLHIALFFLLLVQLASAQPPDFARALPGYSFIFPRDHGAHPDFKIEWWYTTGNVISREGQRFGFKLTFFRAALIPPAERLGPRTPLATDQLYMAHFAISDITNRQHATFERIGRPGLGQGSSSTETLRVEMGEWHTIMTPDARSTETMQIAAQALSDAGTTQGAVRLTLTPAKPRVIHGRDGVHQKADLPGQASHYISFTRLDAQGTLDWQGQRYEVEGLAWMDHEFSSDQLGDAERGWDWFALQLDEGHDLMLYQLKRKDGSYNPHSAGSLIDPAGALRELPGSTYTIEALGTWRSPKTDAVYPMGWRIRVPGEQSELIVTPAFEDQEMDVQRTTGSAYWEGAVTISGTWRGQPTTGKGYVELVGYAGAFALL